MFVGLKATVANASDPPKLTELVIVLLGLAHAGEVGVVKVGRVESRSAPVIPQTKSCVKVVAEGVRTIVGLMQAKIVSFMDGKVCELEGTRVLVAVSAKVHSPTCEVVAIAPLVHLNFLKAD